MANRNWANGKKISIMHVDPVLVDCSFIVDSSDSAGKGIRSLKGPVVQNVFMTTSATPGVGNSNPQTPNIVVTNPDPAAGYLVVQLQDPYNRYLDHKCSIISPLSGSDVKIDNSAMTQGVAYVITTLGNASLAKWQSIGLPKGITPAVGVSFIASNNGGSGNTLTSRVQTAATAGSDVLTLELVSDPDYTISNIPSAGSGFGAYFIFRFMKSSSNASVISAPAAGSKIHLELYLSNSKTNVANNSVS